MFSYPVRVRFYHTDGMQVTHHANYILWFEAARVEFFRQAGIPLGDMMRDEIVFPILHVEVDYHHSSYYDDELEVRAKLIKLTRAQIVFAYEIVRPKDGATIVMGKTKGTFTSVETGKIVRLPMKYYDGLRAMMESEDAE